MLGVSSRLFASSSSEMMRCIMSSCSKYDSFGFVMVGFHIYKPRDFYIYKLYTPRGRALSELPSSTIRLSKPQATTRSERKAQRRLGGYLPETDALPSGRGIDVGA